MSLLASLIEHFPIKFRELTLEWSYLALMVSLIVKRKGINEEFSTYSSVKALLQFLDDGEQFTMKHEQSQSLAIGDFISLAPPSGSRNITLTMLVISSL